MSVERICNEAVVVVSPDDTVLEAVRRMEQYSVGTLVVVDGEKVPVGIVTDRDVALRCVAHGLDAEASEVSDVMSEPVHTVEEGTPIEDALSSMAALGVRRLPVVDESGRLMGILALDDVIDLLSEEAEMIRSLLGRYTPDIPTS